MRDCQPSPVPRKYSTTSELYRTDNNTFGVSDFGRPPLFTVARASMSSVSSGSSSYSAAPTRWASTLARSEPKERADAFDFACIAFPHAKDMAIRATRGVTHGHHAPGQQAKADDAGFAVIPAVILDLQGIAFEHEGSIGEIQSTFGERLVSLCGVAGHLHEVIVATITIECKEEWWALLVSGENLRGIGFAWLSFEPSPRKGTVGQGLGLDRRLIGHCPAVFSPAAARRASSMVSPVSFISCVFTFW